MKWKCVLAMLLCLTCFSMSWGMVPQAPMVAQAPECSDGVCLCEDGCKCGCTETGVCDCDKDTFVSIRSRIQNRRTNRSGNSGGSCANGSCQTESYTPTESYQPQEQTYVVSIAAQAPAERAEQYGGVPTLYDNGVTYYQWSDGIYRKDPQTIGYVNQQTPQPQAPQAIVTRPIQYVTIPQRISYGNVGYSYGGFSGGSCSGGG